MSDFFSSSVQDSASVVVIGAGPAGLIAAETLALAGVQVAVYDAMPSVARKFLLAGKGGMNITHSESVDVFNSRFYEASPWVSQWLKAFSSADLRAWIHELGVETFVGTSGRVFPIEMKAAPLLRKWLHRLKKQGVVFHARHRWVGWGEQGECVFETPLGLSQVAAKGVVLALGGASWPKLGSDASWVPLIEPMAAVTPLKPANCGFVCRWSDFFREKCQGLPLKGVVINMDGNPVGKNGTKGEIMIDAEGVEGSLVYAHSAAIRQQIEATGKASITIDLLPDRSLLEIERVLQSAKGKQSLASFLKKKLKLDSVRFALLRERLSSEQMQDHAALSALLKSYTIELTACFDIRHAISSAGGITQTALEHNLMVRSMPGVFCAGEMLDWEAPTGGYLLTACFASGRYAANGMVTWLLAQAAAKN